MTDADLVQFAADAIFRYLQAHPASADTLEGIHEWWIEWPEIAESMLVTYAALEQLEQAGMLQRSNASPKAVWRLRTLV
jgi:hypothetical protein